MTIFSQIISGDIPSYKVFENELVFAFLDINPIQTGHTLIVPKIEIDYFVDVPEHYYLEVFRVAKIITQALHLSLPIARVATKIEGWEVPHFHYHLVPVRDTKLFHWNTKVEVSKESMQNIQNSIINNIK
jgi:histidine triad (HIT) family protein